MTSSMPGRWIFTTTASPGRSRAAVRLTDRGRRERLPVELGEHVVDAAAELGFQHLAGWLSVSRAATRFCSFGQLVGDLGRDEVDAGRRDLTELDVDAAGLLEHAPQADTRVGRPCAPPGRRRRGTDRSPRAGRGAPARGSGGAPRSACGPRANGRGATTRPARSPIASEPGRASRSSVTATAIVAGIAIANVCRISPSAPQSQSARPSATSTPTPHPTTPDSSAVPHPRRMPSRRSETAVVTTATTSRDDEPRARLRHRRSRQIITFRITIRRGTGHRRRRAGGRSARRTLATSARRGWNASALSASKSNDALGPPSNANS